MLDYLARPDPPDDSEPELEPATQLSPEEHEEIARSRARAGAEGRYFHINPSAPGTMEASVRRCLGQWDEAVVLIDHAMDLSPVTKPWYPTVLASSYYIGQRYEEAAATADEVVSYQPNNLEALLILAASQAALGLERRAHATANIIKDRFPGTLRDEWLDSNPYQDAEFVDRWRSDLESAGLA